MQIGNAVFGSECVMHLVGLDVFVIIQRGSMLTTIMYNTLYNSWFNTKVDIQTALFLQSHMPLFKVLCRHAAARQLNGLKPRPNTCQVTCSHRQA